MEKTIIHSDKLFNSREFGYNQALKTRGGDFLFLAGQTALDAQFQLGEATDLASQARRALQNIAYALEAAGGNPGNLVTMRMFIAAVIAALSTTLRWLSIAPLGKPVVPDV